MNAAPVEKSSPKARLAAATLAALAALALAAAGTSADTVTLKSGQIVEGRVTLGEDTVTLETPYATVTFLADEVAGVEYGPSPLEVYERTLAALEPQDAQGFYRLGLYAEEKRLTAQAREAFERAVVADGDHAGARGRLGYVREDDKWILYEQAMAKRGMVPYRGRYITEAEAAALGAAERALERERELRVMIRTLSFTIRRSGAAARREAQDKLAGMSDPAALTALIETLEDGDAAVRSAVLLALQNYAEEAALLAVLNSAMWDDSEDIRHQARIILNKKQSETVFTMAVGALLYDHDLTRFRASEVLGALGDVRAVPYLIEFLSWTRRRDEVVERVPLRGYLRERRAVGPTYIFGFRAKVAPGVIAYEPIIGGFDRYGNRIILSPDRDRTPATFDGLPPDAPQLVLNYEALRALQALTGQNLRFERDEWRAWYLANARRLRGLPPARAAQ